MQHEDQTGTETGKLRQTGDEYYLKVKQGVSKRKVNEDRQVMGIEGQTGNK